MRKGSLEASGKPAAHTIRIVQYIFTLPYNGYITWTKINSDYGPSKRSGFGMVLIRRPDNVPNKNIACLFGGISGGGRVYHGDTWCFDDSTNKWIEMVAADKVKPLSRAQLGIASYSRNKMLIFGGLGKTTSGPAIFNDLWEFNYEKQQWRDLTPLAKKNSGNLIPSKRYLPLLARLQTFNAFILFQVVLFMFSLFYISSISLSMASF